MFLESAPGSYVQHFSERRSYRAAFVSRHEFILRSDWAVTENALIASANARLRRTRETPTVRSSDPPTTGRRGIVWREAGEAEGGELSSGSR